MPPLVDIDSEGDTEYEFGLTTDFLRYPFDSNASLVSPYVCYLSSVD